MLVIIEASFHGAVFLCQPQDRASLETSLVDPMNKITLERTIFTNGFIRSCIETLDGSPPVNLTFVCTNRCVCVCGLNTQSLTIPGLNRPGVTILIINMVINNRMLCDVKRNIWPEQNHT